MYLKSIQFTQFPNSPQEWILEECTLGNINLVAGKNASGKSKTLNTILSLSKYLSVEKTTQMIFGDCFYKFTFDREGREIVYTLKLLDQKVAEEQLYVGGELLLKRGPGGVGQIKFEKVPAENSPLLDFQTPEEDVAAFTRRDSIQHPFLEDLYEWGKNLMHFQFGTSLGKEGFAIFVKKDKIEPIDYRNTNQPALIFKRGQSEFGNPFAEAVKANMRRVGYDLDSVDIGPPISVRFTFPAYAPPPEPVQGLLVKEDDLPGITDQNDMSQGMFRALCVVIYVTYGVMVARPSCILIDDIGEGLDYERSGNLIRLLVEKAEESNIQLIMSTNDRYSMNNVSLKYWSIANRERNKVRMINYHNRPKVFDDFELTGLTNFDFFSSNYFLNPSEGRN
jgi:energy-coupling factor transporter ATP-binding protein EcfA2